MSSLAKDLRAAITGEVRLSDGDRALYAADASNYRRVPLGVIVPRSIEEIAAAVRVCARHRVPVLHRGGGTSLAGQTSAEGAIVIDSSKYCHHILSIDPEKKTATVEPGAVLDDLRNAARAYHLTFGPDPSTHNHNTLGGMLGNNSCGVHSVESGRTSDNVHALDIMTYDGVRLTVGPTSEGQLEKLCAEPGRVGEIYRGLKRLRDTYADEIRQRYPKIPRRVSGYNLDELLPEKGFHVARALVGSESTCVTILRATLGLIPDPPYKFLLVAGYDSIEHAADAVPDFLPYEKRGLIALEGMDDEILGYMKKKNHMTDRMHLLPKGRGWLFAQIAGWTKEEAEEHAADLRRHIKFQPHFVADTLLEGLQAEVLWDMRKDGLGATVWVPGMRDTWEGWEDSAVAPAALGAYMRDFKQLLKKYKYQGCMYGHFGGGLIHTRIDFGLHTVEDVQRYRAFVEEAAVLVTRHGGSLSGEHGDGTSRSELLPIMFGEKIIEAFAEFKQIWDPQGQMNPHKIVVPKRLDEDLRYGPQQPQRHFETVFQYPESQGVFARAAMRCVGIGECRKHDSGTMCPSFRATREEKHSTRGRARLFQEMVAGDPVRDGWKSEAVKDALDLCLSCKACKHECPVNVDMATYRAEFLYHYYQDRLRPVAAYTMGLVHVWAPLASHAPRLFNFITQRPVLRVAAKWLGGVHRKRPLPELAKKPFTAQWQPSGPKKPIRALLWADTFNNYFTPEPLLAAARLLEASGYEVILPEWKLCCGRPYYDFGRLTEAKKYLARCMDSLAPLLDDRTWLVGIEPSCLTVFRDEIRNLFPNDPRSKHIAEHAVTLGAFLKKHGVHDFHIAHDILVHGHCHHKSILGMTDEIDVLKKAAHNVEQLDSGCCGMAGAFGYERRKYEISQTIAQQRLMPAVRKAAPETLIVADGFSCRSQIAHFTNRHALTLPEVLWQAMKGDDL